MNDFRQPSSSSIPIPVLLPTDLEPTPERPSSPAASELVLCPAHRRKLESLAEMSYPFEACGVLAGTVDDGADGTAVVRVRAVWSARNVGRRSHDRYRLDPEHFLAAERVARDRGLDVVGIWHSHPNRKPLPSGRDLDEAWDGISYVILGVDPCGRVELRSWRKGAGGRTMVEETVIERAVGETS